MRCGVIVNEANSGMMDAMCQTMFPMALTVGDEMALLAYTRQCLKNGKLPGSTDFSNTAPPGTASTQSRWKIKNQRISYFGFRKCRKELMYCKLD